MEPPAQRPLPRRAPASSSRLPDCSPAKLTVQDGSFTATYQRASAFTDADQSFAVIATIITESHRPAHFLRAAAKNGIAVCPGDDAAG